MKLKDLNESSSAGWATPCRRCEPSQPPGSAQVRGAPAGSAAPPYSRPDSGTTGARWSLPSAAPGQGEDEAMRDLVYEDVGVAQFLQAPPECIPQLGLSVHSESVLMPKAYRLGVERIGDGCELVSGSSILTRFALGGKTPPQVFGQDGGERVDFPSTHPVSKHYSSPSRCRRRTHLKAASSGHPLASSTANAMIRRPSRLASDVPKLCADEAGCMPPGPSTAAPLRAVASFLLGLAQSVSPMPERQP